MKYLIVLQVLVGQIAFAKNFTPAECPVVGNTDSKKFHTSGHLYKKMLIKNKGSDNRICFKNVSEAMESGFVKSKSRASKKSRS